MVYFSKMRGANDQQVLMTQFALLLLLSFCLFTSPSSAENKLFDSIEPIAIVISSTTLTANNESHTALFEGSVLARIEEGVFYSDTMLVSYTEGGNATRIDAKGHVKLLKGDRVFSSDSATYFSDNDKFIFIGDPTATEGGEHLSGTTIIYLMKQDRLIIEH